MSELCSVPWTGPSYVVLSPMQVQKSTALGVWQYRGLTSTPLTSKAAVAIYRKKTNRRCFTVQVSKAAQMLIPSTSAEEASGTEPCFYLSPSSSEVTEAEEELFRALTDMFSICTCLQGRTGRETCPEAPAGQWHDAKTLPASPVDSYLMSEHLLLTVLTEMWWFGKTSLQRCGIITNTRTWIRRIPNTSEKSCHMECGGKWCWL